MAYRMNYGFGGIPPMVRQLMLINAVVFLFTALLHGTTYETLIRWFSLIPAYGVGKLMVWQFVTYMFLHGGFWHILSNMFALWVFGSDLERWWGSRAFLRFYLICGVGGGVFQVASAYIVGEQMRPIVGASGAIFGVMVAFAVAFPNRELFLIPLSLIFGPIPARIYVGIMMLFVLWGSFGSGESNVANFAHLGGAVVGFVYLKRERLLWRYQRMRGSLRSSMPRPGGSASTPDEQQRSETMDRILEKISREGMNSLTPQERKFLEEAGERARRKQQGRP